MTTPRFDLRTHLSTSLRDLAAVLTENGAEVRLVGGAVRDILCGLHPKDFDLATPLTPDDVKAVLRRAGVRTVDTGIAHGTITAIVDGSHRDRSSAGFETYEVTTLRRDVSTDGRRATVAWTTSWEEDAARRDLTINALSMSLDGVVFDYHGGLKDLHDRRIRFVGDAGQRVREDYLRVLRFFRFLGRWPGAEAEPAALEAIATHGTGLAGLVSGERIWSEMQKILLAPDLRRVLGLMRETGVLGLLRLADDDAALDAAATAAARTSSPVAALVAMQEAGGREEVYRHIAETWRWSVRETHLARFLSRHAGGPLTERQALDLLVDGADPHFVALAARGAGADAVAQYAETCEVPILPIRGVDLLARGYTQGPTVGVALAFMKQAWRDSGYAASREDLLALWDEVRDTAQASSAPTP